MIYTETMSVRLTPDLDVLLKEIAEEEGIPPAMLARNWLIAEMRRRKPERFSPRHEGDDDA